MRCVTPLFAATLPFSEVLRVWDFLFGGARPRRDATLDLDAVHSVTVAAVIQLRHRLLRADRFDALSLLNRLPALDVDDMLSRAAEIHSKESVCINGETPDASSRTDAIDALNRALTMVTAADALDDRTRREIAAQLESVASFLRR